MVVPFDSKFTKVSCDSTGPYFDVYMDGLQPERYYRILVKSELDKVGYRTVLDISNEKINYKIRHHSLQKVPFIVDVGKQEVENKTVSVRRLGSNDQESLTLPQLLSELNEKNKY